LRAQRRARLRARPPAKRRTLSLGDLLRQAASSNPDAVAFVHGDRQLTYAEWNRRSDGAAFHLWRIGVRPGDVVAMLMGQRFEYPIGYLAAAKIGAVTAGVNPRLADREVEHILQNSDAVVFVREDRSLGHPREIDPGELMEGDGDPPAVSGDGNSAVTIVYTSGTTGLPKGATYTQRSIDTIRKFEEGVETIRTPVGLAATPLAHMGFMTKIGSFIGRRGKNVLMDRWSARGALELIERERITHIGGIPTQLALMLMDPEFGRFDLSSVQQCLIGGAPASPDLVRQVRQAFKVPVMVRYSCSELGMATSTRPDDDDEVVANTVGRPLPGVDLHVAHGDDSEVGEVLIRSPAMMTGYWRNPEATRDAFDRSGRFRTGDLGRLRSDGNVVLAGRTKEMYIRGGYNVYPMEVESALREHPRVAMCAVIGVPDEVLGEKGLALVVPRAPDDPPSPGELKAFVAERIADYKVPDFVEIRAELPLNAMFKVDKQALVAELRKRD
jgi:acyl-CoA synthetase (AMP-forming)/AMP-acid ligase II